MNDLSVKPAHLTDPQAAKSNGKSGATALAGLATSFQDLVSKVGINFDSGLNEIAGKSGITAVGENTQPRQHADDQASDPRDDGRERFVDRGADDRSDRDRGEPQRADRNDDDSREAPASHRDDSRDSRSDNHEQPRDEQRAEAPERTDKPARDDHQANDQGSAEAGQKGEGQAAASESGEKGNANTGGNGETAGNAQAQSLDTTTLINAVGGLTQTEQGPAADAGKASAAAGLAVAADAAKKQAGVHSAQTGNGNHQSQGQQNANAGAQAQNQQVDPNARANTNIQQQAAQLAQTMGQDGKVKVDVAVNQEAEKLASRPTASLASGVAVASETKGNAQSGQQTANHAAANAQNPNAVNQAAQAQGGQAQAQNQQTAGQNAQAQTAVQASSASNAGSGGASGVHSAGPTAAGGESANSANAATANTGTQQTQQSQQAQQTAQTARPQQAMQSSVAEQVSVKITKALQAGQDRITIRLNPAELGRVEVKMELTHDGRTTAIITADNRDTLDLLRRDSSDLQKALEEGGLKLADADLEFNLRGEEGQMAEEEGNGSGTGAGDEEEMADEFVDQEPEIIVAHEGGVLINGRLDVRA